MTFEEKREKVKDLRPIDDVFFFPVLSEEVAKLKETEGGLNSMCQVMQHYEEIARREGRVEGRVEGHREGRAEGRAEGHREGRAEGRAEGHREGRVEGHAEGKKEMALGMHKNGIADSIIADIAGVPVEVVQGWISQ